MKGQGSLVNKSLLQFTTIAKVINNPEISPAAESTVLKTPKAAGSIPVWAIYLYLDLMILVVPFQLQIF